MSQLATATATATAKPTISNNKNSYNFINIRSNSRSHTAHVSDGMLTLGDSGVVLYEIF